MRGKPRAGSYRCHLLDRQHNTAGATSLSDDGRLAASDAQARSLADDEFESEHAVWEPHKHTAGSLALHGTSPVRVHSFRLRRAATATAGRRPVRRDHLGTVQKSPYGRSHGVVAAGSISLACAGRRERAVARGPVRRRDVGFRDRTCVWSEGQTAPAGGWGARRKEGYTSGNVCLRAGGSTPRISLVGPASLEGLAFKPRRTVAAVSLRTAGGGGGRDVQEGEEVLSLTGAPPCASDAWGCLRLVLAHRLESAWRLAGGDQLGPHGQHLGRRRSVAAGETKEEMRSRRARWCLPGWHLESAQSAWQKGQTHAVDHHLRQVERLGALPPAGG